MILYNFSEWDINTTYKKNEKLKVMLNSQNLKEMKTFKNIRNALSPDNTSQLMQNKLFGGPKVLKLKIPLT